MGKQSKKWYSTHSRNEEMRRLRKADKDFWTYKRLAGMFDISPERCRQICTYPHIGRPRET